MGGDSDAIDLAVGKLTIVNIVGDTGPPEYGYATHAIADRLHN